MRTALLLATLILTSAARAQQTPAPGQVQQRAKVPPSTPGKPATAQPIDNLIEFFAFAAALQNCKYWFG